MRALIVGSEGARGSLAAARALAATGWIVGVASPARGITSASRAVSRRHEVPPPHDLKAFVRAVNSAIVAGGYEVVFAGGDAEVLALSAMRTSIRGIVPSPQHASVTTAVDKIALTRAASAAGLAIPRPVDPSDEGLTSARYPVIVKPSLHWSLEKTAAPGRVEARVARDPAEARRAFTQLTAEVEDVLIQEIVAGPLVAYTVLVADDGKIIGEVQQSAERLWPPRSGVSARARTEPLDPDLRRSVARLMDRLGWVGIAQIQFIRGDDHRHYLIDLNARFYGSLALAVGAGCDLPSAWANLATDRPIEISEPRIGVRYQWLEGDLRRALVERRGGRRADIAECLAYARGAVHSVWKVDDPVPSAVHAAGLSARTLRKVLG